MPILIDILWLLVGLASLYFGAEWLVRGSSNLAVKFGISPLVVGLTIVAFGTSAPELFVSIGFNQNGYPDMALGNVIGSNICNIGLVLGASAFICVLTVKSQIILRDLPFLLVATLVFCWMLRDGRIGLVDGAILSAGIVGFTFFQLFIVKRVKDPEVLEEFSAEVDPEAARGKSAGMLVFLIVTGLVALYFGAGWLERGGVSLAERMGVPQAVISLTLIAFSTSVPELATSVVASFKREADIIIGNIVGSCIFNLLCVVGITALVKPIVTTQIEMTDLLVMTGITFVLLPLVWLRKRVGRWEGGFFLVCYTAYSIFLFYDRVV